MVLETFVFLKMMTAQQVTKMMAGELKFVYNLQMLAIKVIKIMALGIYAFLKITIAQLAIKTMEEKLSCVFC